MPLHSKHLLCPFILHSKGSKDRDVGGALYRDGCDIQLIPQGAHSLGEEVENYQLSCFPRQLWNASKTRGSGAK